MKAIKFNFLLLLFITTTYSQNSLVINNLEAGPGENSKITIGLNNTDNVSGFQFKIKVPSTLSVMEKEVEFVGRNTDHIIYPRALGNGEYLFLCLSSSNSNLQGNSGAIIEIPIEIPLNYTPSDTYAIEFTEAIVSSSTGEDIGSNHQNGVLTIVVGKTPDLEVKNITVNQNEIIPNAECTINWTVENIGQSSAIGGWREQVALISQTNGKKFIIANEIYSNTLLENQFLQRTTTVTVPSIIGFNGPVKVEVSLVTNSNIKEPLNNKANNVALSLNTKNLAKRLILSLDKSELDENSAEPLRVYIARSGNTLTDEIFTLNSDISDVFNSPMMAQINKDESSTYIDLSPTNNDLYHGNRQIELQVSGNTYTTENISFDLLDDENIILSLDYPSDYNSAIGDQISFTLNANFAVDEDSIILISTNEADRLGLPDQIILPANSKTVSFNGTILDNNEVETSKKANIIAKAEGYTSAITDIDLEAINIPNFTMSIDKNDVSESDGLKAAYLTLTRTDQIDKRVTLEISTDISDKLIIPSEVLFAEGESQIEFYIGVIDNALVESSTPISITAKIKFNDCSCTDNETNTSISKSITVIDNDDYALSISLSPSTIKAGATDNTLTVSRNVSDTSLLENPVTINLSSDYPEIALLPNTVTIPANETVAQINYNTQIIANQTEDINLRIEANANNYNSGFGWLLVTNQNNPDVVVQQLTAPSSVEAGSRIEVKSYIKNQGNTVFPAKSKIDYYLSETTDIGNLDPIVSSIVNTPIDVNTLFEYTESIQLPNYSGDYYLITVINGDFAISELDFDNNQNDSFITILPQYTVEVNIEKHSFSSNETITIMGVAKNARGNLIPDADIALKIKNEEFERLFSTKTNANGSFVFEYKPLDNETGSYTIAASFPGEEVIPQEQFELLGVDIIGKPQFIKWETVVGSHLGKEFNLKNKTNTRLTGVKIQIPENANFSIEQTPINIDPGQTVNFQFRIIPVLASEELKYTEFNMILQSNEGNLYSETAYYYCKNQESKLMATPITINTTMSKNEKRLYEFSVKNIGAIDAENVKILLPELDWLSLKSSQDIERIKPNENAKIVLEFEPTVKEQVNVPITGNLVISQSTGPALSVPFRIETVSELTGSLTIEATDEYTYNTASAPRLRNAKVVVKHPFNGTIISEGYTDDNGLFEVSNINEGWYVIDITAEKHNPYQNNILVDPGRETKLTAFLPYQAITYSWNVEETEVLDEYDISLQVAFETNVPLPVVVMELDNPNLDLDPGQSRMTYITATNHGLIALNKVNITTGLADDYVITPLISSLDVLQAKTSITIPVLVKNVSNVPAPTRNSDTQLSAGTSSCTIPVTLIGTFPCDGEKEATAYTTYINRCPGNPSPTIPTCTGCTGGAGTPGGSGSGGRGGARTGGGAVTLTTAPNLCDPCTQKGISAVLGCLATFTGAKTLSKAACVFNVATSSGVREFRNAVDGCIKKSNPILDAWDCGYCIGTYINDCLINSGATGSPPISDNDNHSFYNQIFSQSNLLNQETSNDPFDLIGQDFDRLNEANEAKNNFIKEYINTPELEDNPDLILFIDQLADHIDDELQFSQEDSNTIKNNLSTTSITNLHIDTFISRWNTTIDAWNANIYSPNTQYPNIVNKIKIDGYKKIMSELETYVFSRGFVSPADMYDSDIKFIDDYLEEKTSQEASVCATVTIEFPQRLTMTRQAFEGTLKINNSSDKEVSQVFLDLIVTDENGENKTHLFQINKDTFLNGTGTVNPNDEGQGIALFIPTKEAAPVVVQSYSFGGILSYFDPEVGEIVNITLNPVTLEVNPSPDLILRYFMQRDIFGDDPLTDDIVEPSIEAELGLLILNDGYGIANNVNVESMEPRIIENEKGLLVDFNLLGSSFNNESLELGLFNIDFGNFEAKEVKVGQWFFTSSLIGHFVEYDIMVNHKSNYGNENLSLIKGAYIHELIKSVKTYGNGNDNISDFLVNDITDVHDLPDMIYLSDGTSEDVSKAEAFEILNEVNPTSLTATVKMSPSAPGWNYDRILNPLAKNYKITRVVRDSDNTEIPIQNVWQTDVTLRDGLNPKYETTLHILDKITDIQTYTIHYNPIDGNIPQVEQFINPPEPYNNESIKLITVKFNKEIDFNTFNHEDLRLIHQGTELATDNILIGQIDPTTYSINLENVTAQSGFYELTVNTIDIKDNLGNEGRNGKKINWIQFNNELGILSFQSDQIKKNPINSIHLIFNKPIRTEEFTQNRITINDQSVNDLSIQKIDDYNYAVSGINSLNQNNGNYTIAIDVTQIKAEDGSSGLALQTFDWIVDNNLPKVVNINTISQGASNTQIVTGLDIELNRKLNSNLEASSFVFKKNGQEIQIPISINKVDDLNYIIYGLNGYTSDNGSYYLTIDQSDFIDENDNSGEGLAEKSWTVNVQSLMAISDVRINPDRGISNSDNITSGENIQLMYKTTIENVTVDVYELQGSSEILIDSQFRINTSEYSIPLNNPTGGRRYKVVAYDTSGNRSNAEVLSTFIDSSDVLVDIEPVNEIVDDCTDFDYIEITFSENINENSFTQEALVLKSKGEIIPKDNISIRKINGQKYTIENIESQNNGSITMEIDKSFITKEISGMHGSSIESQEIGNPNLYPVDVSGEEEAELGIVYEYTASAGMNKYDWIVLNGEIISIDENKINLRWNKTGEQSIILRYLTPTNCTLTSTLNVTVEEGSVLGVEQPVTVEKNFISPIPNNGTFTIHTSTYLNNCTLSIYDISGRLVHQEQNVNLSGNMKSINSNLKSGTYILLLQNNETRINLRFIVH